MQLINFFSSFLVLIVLNPLALGKAEDLDRQNGDLDRDTGIRLTVNSNADNNQRDNQLTLREAIAIANGSLPISDLTIAEKRNISPPMDRGTIRIEFDFPPEQNTIQLLQPLPPITSPGLAIDGLALERGFVEPNPGKHNREKQPRNGQLFSINEPLVNITRDPNAPPILRGLTVMADNVTIRGLSLYGFSAEKATGSTPSAEIFISGHVPEAFFRQQPVNIETINVPKNITIEENWLGRDTARKSTFGIWIFNAKNTLIQGNRITHHKGSGILSSINAQNLQIDNNLIANNGSAGMPDGIRLEGNVSGSIVSNNEIYENGGAGIFLFKPIGSVQILENKIEFNGQRIPHPAIYLMGEGHEAIANQIRSQNGPGVVVSGNPKSDRNRIQGNQFADLQGLSIDLNADNGRNSTTPRPYYGDGPNPERNSFNRRLDTGNSGINAPRFLASEFMMIDGQVNIDGMADPDTVVEIYRVLEDDNAYGPLSEPLLTVETDAEGRFGVTLTDIEPRDIISATATHQDYGTSEPSRNAAIGLLGTGIR